MKPKIFPCFKYHEKHGARVFKSEQEWDEMEPGHGWGSHPAKLAAAALKVAREKEMQESVGTKHESEDAPHSPPHQEASADVERPPSPAKKIFGKGKNK